MKCYFDTLVLAPAAVVGHPHHLPAMARLQELAEMKQKGVMSAHGLMEFYSVLTRTPFQPPLHSSEVWRMIESLIPPHLKLIPLTAKEYADVTKACSIAGWTGGRIYDAVISAVRRRRDAPESTPSM